MDVLAGARALLFPIEWDECFGLVAIEALACGTPVIATPRGALPEIVRHGVDSFLVAGVEDALDALRQLDRLDPCDCRHRIEEAFDIRAVAGAYQSVYERIVRRTRRSPAHG